MRNIKHHHSSVRRNTANYECLLLSPTTTPRRKVTHHRAQPDGGRGHDRKSCLGPFAKSTQNTRFVIKERFSQTERDYTTVLGLSTTTALDKPSSTESRSKLKQVGILCGTASSGQVMYRYNKNLPQNTRRYPPTRPRNYKYTYNNLLFLQEHGPANPPDLTTTRPTDGHHPPPRSREQNQTPLAPSPFQGERSTQPPADNINEKQNKPLPPDRKKQKLTESLAP